MDPRILALVSEISSSPAMGKMAAIDKLAKELNLNQEAVSDFVLAVCRLVSTNLDKAAESRKFIDYVFEAALAAGPEILQVMAKNTALLQQIIMENAKASDA